MNLAFQKFVSLKAQTKRLQKPSLKISVLQLKREIICASEELLFLDEPVSGLDPKVTADFYEQIQKINKGGVTIVMISHDIHAVMSYASHILHVGRSETFFGTITDFMNSEQAKKLGIAAGKEEIAWNS